MKNKKLIEDHLIRAEHRFAALEVLLTRNAYADVVREAQELVELCLKALLRMGNIEVPRIHDVGDILLENRSRFPDAAQSYLERFAEISRKLRRDRELAYYGSDDLTPTEFYKKTDAASAFEDAKFVLGHMKRLTSTL